MDLSAFPENFIDWTEALGRVEGDEEFLHELLHDFDDLLSQKISEIKSAIDNGDSKLYSELAHSVKGAAGNMSMNAIFDICYTMELNGNEGRMEDATQLISALEDMYGLLKKLLDQIS